MKDFSETLNLFREANILNELEFSELSAFQKKSEIAIQQSSNPTIEIAIPPPYNFEGIYIHKNKEISKKVLEYLKKETETQESLDIKKKALETFNEILQKIDFTKANYFEGKFRFDLYGSLRNQFSLKGSDIDVSINIDNEDYNEKELINFFYKQIKKVSPNKKELKIDIIPDARVPIVEITFLSMDNITVSLSINNKLGVINSKFLKTYSEFDKRCQLLGILVKLWAKCQNVISVKNQFLSSYAYNLMVINFLQTIETPLLPSLQKLRYNEQENQPQYVILPKSVVEKNLSTSELSSKIRVDYEEDIIKVQKLMEDKGVTKNDQSVITLLRSFFKFYMKKKNVEGIKLSVKEGAHIKREESQDPKKDYLYSIEDPFDPFHNPGKFILKNSYEAHKLLNSMKKSYYLLKEGKIMDIFQISE